MVAREDFAAGEKLSICWRDPRRIIRHVNGYAYLVGDLKNGSIEDVHLTLLKFYHDAPLNCEAIMPHGFSSKTGIEVQRLIGLF